MEYKKDEAFISLMPRILKWEGGYSDHPNDPGGATNKGITQGTYNAWRRANGLPQRPVRQLTIDELYNIYYRNYWLASKADKIKDRRLQYIHFDAAVNHGVGQATKFLSRLPHNPEHFVGSGLFESYFNQRKAFYELIAQRNPKLKVFMKGWMNRMKDILAAKL